MVDKTDEKAHKSQVVERRQINALPALAHCAGSDRAPDERFLTRVTRVAQTQTARSCVAFRTRVKYAKCEGALR